jgi:putative ABC transport system ATP-binding protein
MNDNPATVAIREMAFTWAGSRTPVLKIESLQLASSERLFIKGGSGSGKSTLLSLIAGINTATEGSIKVLGQELSELKGRSRDRFRADHMGVIFQQFNLLPYLSVLDNVVLPCHFSHRRHLDAVQNGGVLMEARRLLAHLDIGDELLTRKASELSVGQQQRVAAARALIGSPELVIADEPTSSLDADRRDVFLDLLFRECAEEGASLLFVSHDAGLEPLFDRAIHLDEVNDAA